jgi:hypothetical protein
MNDTQLNNNGGDEDTVMDMMRGSMNEMRALY